MGPHDYLRRRVLAAVYGTLPAGELFARARAGDPEAFVALVRDRYALVAAAARRRLRPGEPVEDVVLDTFAELWRQREAVADPEKVDGWLTRTADRLAVRWVADRVRERNWRPADPASSSPDDAAALAELADRVQRAVSELGAADRAVIAAAGAFESDTAAAAALELPVNRYRVRLHRARERLRPILERYGLGPVLGLLGWAGGLLGRARVATAALAVVAVGLAWHATGPTTSAQPRSTGRTPPAVTEEAVQARNLRVFQTEVLPLVLTALRPMVADGGEPRLERATVFDTRLDAVFVLGSGPARIRMLADADVRRTTVLLDLFNRGRWVRFLQPTAGTPTVVLRPWAGGPGIDMPMAPLKEAAAAFDRLPRDGRTAAEGLRCRAALAAVLAGKWGGWRHRGDPAEVWQLTWPADDDRPRLAAPAGSRWSQGDGRPWHRIEPDGPVGGALFFEDEATRFSADGRRLTFTRTNDWWERAD